MVYLSKKQTMLFVFRYPEILEQPGDTCWKFHVEMLLLTLFGF